MNEFTASYLPWFFFYINCLKCQYSYIWCSFLYILMLLCCYKPMTKESLLWMVWNFNNYYLQKMALQLEFNIQIVLLLWESMQTSIGNFFLKPTLLPYSVGMPNPNITPSMIHLYRSLIVWLRELIDTSISAHSA